LDAKYTFIPDLPYNVLLGPNVILRPSNNVDTANVAVVIPELWKALSPMLVTEEGMVIDVKPVIPWKALAPMLATEEGIVMDVKPVASWKALAPMLLKPVIVRLRA
jgi:hypothetical protein